MCSIAGVDAVTIGDNGARMTQLAKLFVALTLAASLAASAANANDDDADEYGVPRRVRRFAEGRGRKEPLAKLGIPLAQPIKDYYRREFFVQEKALQQSPAFTVLLKAAFLVGRTTVARVGAIGAEEALAAELALAWPELRPANQGWSECDKFDIVYKTHVLDLCDRVVWAYWRFWVTFRDEPRHLDADIRAHDFRLVGRLCDRVVEPRFKSAVYHGFRALRCRPER